MRILNKKTVEKIKRYPSTLDVFYTSSEESGIFTIDFDGCQGAYTREDWIDEDLSDFGKDSQEMILSALEGTCNNNFFLDQ